MSISNCSEEELILEHILIMMDHRVNTKATLRLPLDKLLPLVPSILHQYLRSSRWYATRSNSLLLQADSSRKQSVNVEDCKKKLHDLLVSAGKSAVRAEVSPEKKAKLKREYVIALLGTLELLRLNLSLCSKKAWDEARLTSKKAHSSKKSSRRSGSGSDY